MSNQMPGEAGVRAIAGLILALLIAGAVFLIWKNGKDSADFSNVKAGLATTEESAGISRTTADTVATDQAKVWADAQADEGIIHERINSLPRPVAGPADPDVLRVARKAHARALCAASGVQRAGCSDDPAGATVDR